MIKTVPVVVWRRRPFSFFYLWAGKEKWSGVSRARIMGTCARPRAELSKRHDSIIRERKSTDSKSLVASSACIADSMLVAYFAPDTCVACGSLDMQGRTQGGFR